MVGLIHDIDGKYYEPARPEKQHHQRTWLTPKGDPSSSSVMSFAGKTKWREDLPSFDNYIFEVADCHGKVRLHKTAEQTKEDWIEQLRRLQSHLDEYLDFLST